MEFYASASTDIGVSRKENQDRLFVEQFLTDYGKIVVAVLCDGMGGLKYGEVASESIVAAFSQWAQASLQRPRESALMRQELQRQWTLLIEEQNKRIRSYGQMHKCILGSTVTAILLTEKYYCVLNVGDSRAYELRKEARQLTQDHSLLADEIRLGNILPEQAKDFPMKNVLTRCVGVASSVTPDFFFGETKTDAVYLICSDGFWHNITKEEMHQILIPASGEVLSWLRSSNEKLIELNKVRGETDNISVITIYTKPSRLREDESRDSR